jgi:hypothetical protein
MSLDVYLYIEADTGGPEPRTFEIYSANVTHNLGKMAREAGVYRHLWHPEEVGVETAADLIAPLAGAIVTMKADPERFRALNSENGWGCFDGFVPWLEGLLQQCQENPKAKVRVCR